MMFRQNLQDKPLTCIVQNFRNASPLLQEFHAHHPDQPGPSVRLGEWLVAYHQGGVAASHDDDNTPVFDSHSSLTHAASASVAAKKPYKVTKTKRAGTKKA